MSYGDYSNRDSIHTDSSSSANKVEQPQVKESKLSKLTSKIETFTSQVTKSLKDIKASVKQFKDEFLENNPITPRLTPRLNENGEMTLPLKEKLTPKDLALYDKRNEIQLNNTFITRMTRELTEQKTGLVRKERQIASNVRVLSRLGVLNESDTKQLEQLKESHKEIKAKLRSTNEKLTKFQSMKVENDNSIVNINQQLLESKYGKQLVSKNEKTVVTNTVGFDAYVIPKKARLERIANKLQAIAEQIDNKTVPSEKMTKSELQFIKDIESHRNYINRNKARHPDFSRSLSKVSKYGQTYNKWFHASKNLRRDDVWNYKRFTPNGPAAQPRS